MTAKAEIVTHMNGLEIGEAENVLSHLVAAIWLSRSYLA